MYDHPRRTLPFRIRLNTMTTPVSPRFHAPCFLPKDPPHRTKIHSPPSTVSTFLLLNQTPQLNTVSTLLPLQRSLPPCNQLPSNSSFLIVCHFRSTVAKALKSRVITSRPVSLVSGRMSHASPPTTQMISLQDIVTA